MWRGLEKAVQAILHRNAAGQEIGGPGKIWGTGFSLATTFSQEATAASGRSAAVHSLFLLSHPALGVGRRWDCSAGSAGSLLQGERRKSSLLPSTVSVTACAWVMMEMWTSSCPPQGFSCFVAPSISPPIHCMYSPVCVPPISNRLNSQHHLFCNSLLTYQVQQCIDAFLVYF